MKEMFSSLFAKMLIPTLTTSSIAVAGGSSGYLIFNNSSKTEKKNVLEEIKEIEVKGDVEEIDQNSQEYSSLIENPEVIAERIVKGGKINGGGDACYRWKKKDDSGYWSNAEELKDQECKKLVNDLKKENQGEQPSNWLKVKKENFSEVIRESGLSFSNSVSSEVGTSWTGNFVSCKNEEDSKNKEIIIVKCEIDYSQYKTRQTRR